MIAAWFVFFWGVFAKYSPVEDNSDSPDSFPKLQNYERSEWPPSGTVRAPSLDI